MFTNLPPRPRTYASQHHRNHSTSRPHEERKGRKCKIFEVFGGTSDQIQATRTTVSLQFSNGGTQFGRPIEIIKPWSEMLLCFLRVVVLCFAEACAPPGVIAATHFAPMRAGERWVGGCLPPKRPGRVPRPPTPHAAPQGGAWGGAREGCGAALASGGILRLGTFKGLQRWPSSRRGP